MVVRFHSFQESKAHDFVESPAKERNRGPGAGIHYCSAELKFIYNLDQDTLETNFFAEINWPLNGVGGSAAIAWGVDFKGDRRHVSRFYKYDALNDYRQIRRYNNEHSASPSYGCGGKGVQGPGSIVWFCSRGFEGRSHIYKFREVFDEELEVWRLELIDDRGSPERPDADGIGGDFFTCWHVDSSQWNRETNAALIFQLASEFPYDVIIEYDGPDSETWRLEGAGGKAGYVYISDVVRAEAFYYVIDDTELREIVREPVPLNGADVNGIGGQRSGGNIRGSRSGNHRRTMEKKIANGEATRPERITGLLVTGVNYRLGLYPEPIPVMGQDKRLGRHPTWQDLRGGRSGYLVLDGDVERFKDRPGIEILEGHQAIDEALADFTRHEYVIDNPAIMAASVRQLGYQLDTLAGLEPQQTLAALLEAGVAGIRERVIRPVPARDLAEAWGVKPDGA